MSKKKHLPHHKSPPANTRCSYQEQLYTKILKYGWLGLFLLLPLLRSRTYLGIESVKFFASSVTILILTAISAVGLHKGYLSWPKIRITTPILIYTAVLIMSTAMSADPLTSIFGFYPHFHTGVLTKLLAMILFYVILVSRPTRDDIEKCLKAMTVVGFGIGLYAIIESYDILNLGSNFVYVTHRVEGIFQNSDITFAYLIFLLPFYFYFFVNEANYKPRIFYAIAIPVILFSLFKLMPSGLQFSLSAAKWKAMPLLILALTAFLYDPLRIRIVNILIGHKKKMLIALACVVAALVLAGLFNSNTIKQSLGNTLSSENNVERFWGWRAGIENGLKYPLFGSGPATISYFLPTIRQAIPFDNWNDNNTTHNVHSEILDRFAMTGILGLALYLYLRCSLFYSAIAGIRRQSNNSKGLIMAFLAGSLLLFFFNQLFFLVLATIYLPWLAMAAILVLDQSVQYIPLQHNKILAKGAMTAGTLFASILTIYLSIAWIADYTFSKGVNRSNGLTAFDTAAKLNPLNPIYQMYSGYQSYYQIVEMERTGGAILEPASRRAIIEACLADLQKTVELQPLYAKGWANYGTVLLGMKEYDPNTGVKAEDAFKKAIELNPNSERLRAQIGLGYSLVNDYNQAEKYLDEAVSMSTRYTKGTIYHLYGQISAQKGDKDKAVSMLENAKKNQKSLTTEVDKLIETIRSK